MIFWPCRKGEAGTKAMPENNNLPNLERFITFSSAGHRNLHGNSPRING